MSDPNAGVPSKSVTPALDQVGEVEVCTVTARPLLPRLPKE
jgi:hypothetical protein